MVVTVIAAIASIEFFVAYIVFCLRRFMVVSVIVAIASIEFVTKKERFF